METTTVIKPGWKTSDLWFHVLAAMAVAGITTFEASNPGLPALAQGAFGLMAPVALAWLAKSYGDVRTQKQLSFDRLKAATLLADKTPTPQ